MGGIKLENYLDLHSIGNIRNMEVIDINTGVKLGYIKDLKIDCDDFKVLSLIMPCHKISWFGKTEEKEIPWENIKKVGVDVILVAAQEELIKDYILS